MLFRAGNSNEENIIRAATLRCGVRVTDLIVGRCVPLSSGFRYMIVRDLKVILSKAFL